MFQIFFLYIHLFIILWSLDLDLQTEDLNNLHARRYLPSSRLSMATLEFCGFVHCTETRNHFSNGAQLTGAAVHGWLGWRTLTLWTGKDHQKLDLVGRKQRNRREGSEILCDMTPQSIYKFQEVFVRFMIFTHSQSKSMICYIGSSPQVGGQQNLFQISPIQVNISKTVAFIRDQWPSPNDPQKNRISRTCLSLFIFISQDFWHKNPGLAPC